MAQQLINIGVTADDGTGDTIRGAGIKINNNFTELYAQPLALTSLGLIENEISTTQSNADIVLKPSGTGAVVFPAIRFNDNNIEGTRSNDDIRFIPNGVGQLVIDGLGFSGTSITAIDSSTVNFNENLVVDGSVDAGATTFESAVTANSTFNVSDTATLSSLTVAGATSFVGITTVDNITFNDNIIGTSSNADLNLTPGGAGVVKVSNLTIDSSINLTDNVIKVTRSNDDMVLSGNGTGNVQITNSNINEGTIDNTVIGATTPAAGTFTTITAPSLNADEINITDNKIKVTTINEDLEFSASGTGNVLINGFTFPNTVLGGGQLIQTNGSKILSTVVFPFVVADTDVQDGTATLVGDSSTQVIDSFSTSTYRSAKYHIQISDTTADRYKLQEVNVTHDGSTAYISITDGASNGAGDGSTTYDTLDISVDVSGGNVRLLGTVNNTNTQVIKFIKRVIKV